jgi:hypothetical protein
MQASDRDRKWGAVPVGLILVGVLAAVVAVTADTLGIGGRGFGATQALLLIAGLVVVLTGVVSLRRGPDGHAHERRRVVSGPVQILALSTWFGLAAGLPELANGGLMQLFDQPVLGKTTHAVWLIPFVSLPLFLVAGVVLAGLGRRFDKLRSVGGLTSVLSFGVLFAGLLLFEEELHVVALLLVAAGISVQAGRLARRHGGEVLRLTRLTLAPLILLWIVVALWGRASPGLSEGRALRSSPLPPDGAMNVLLLILDTVRAPSMSVYGYDRPTTPNLQALAERAVTFERAFSTAPWTLPSHGSLFTGRYPHDLSAAWLEPLDDTHPTLAEILSARGYRTAGFVANRLYAAAGSGLSRGFTHYDADIVSVTEALGSFSLTRYLAERSWLRKLIGTHQVLGRKSAENINAEFLSWLSRSSDRPFFAFLNYYDAHDPYIPPRPFRGHFGSPDADCPPELWSPSSLRSAQAIAPCVDAYDASLAYLDEQLGVLLRELERRGQLANTLVIVTSDHGEEFAEHGLMNHGRSLYLPSLHVPLILSLGGLVPPGIRPTEPVSIRAIPTTVMELIGEDSPFPGEPLSRWWQASAAASAGVAIPGAEEWIAAETGAKTWLTSLNPVSKGNMLSLVARGRHYIRSGDGYEELFDIVGDPLEQENLIGGTEGSEDVEWYRATSAPLAERYAARRSP